MIGQTVGKYRIVARLGRGGMGTVYKAVDETLGRDVAIKILNPDVTDEEVLKRFRAEALTLARLNHPNIATLYELTEHEDDLVMVMEFVRGETFDRLSDRVGPVSFDRAAFLCSQVLDALGHAHRAGIVHRDLKPANLMIAESGIVKVMDFGIARMVGTERITTDGYMMGTPAYMAPEQVTGEELDGRADLYAIGVVFYRLLTANLPFKADTAIAMAQKQIKDPPTPLYQFSNDLPASCQAILDRALAKAPHDRFQTAEDFRAALGQLIPAGSPLESVTSTFSIPTPSAASKATHTAARSRRAAVLVAGAVLVATGLAGVGWVRARQAPAPVAATPDPSQAVPVAPPEPAHPNPDTSVATLSNASAALSNAPAARPGNPPAPAVPAILPSVKFDSIGVLMVEGGKARERDASLRLTSGAMQIVQGAQRLKNAPYGSIVAIFHSRSKEPQWVTPDGAVVPVAKVEGGRLRLFGGNRDWVTVRTRSGFISLRTATSAVTKVVAALEARTGLKAIRAAAN
jgi:serine/threonine-protein kinase